MQTNIPQNRLQRTRPFGGILDPACIATTFHGMLPPVHTFNDQCDKAHAETKQMRACLDSRESFQAATTTLLLAS